VQRQTRWMARDRIGELRELAGQENDWEIILKQQMREEGLSVGDWRKIQGSDWGTRTWERDLHAVETELTVTITEAQMKVVDLSAKQLELVEKERELWTKERAERRREKMLAKIAKKLRKTKATASSQTEPV
jgi:hypothetical protein